ncbi:MAG: hypothetical protein WC869_15215 [Phycisphaerae bacterium]|jgi:hypothetical protein
MKRMSKTTEGRRRRGSVILLVVGLLTILAMLGSALLLVSRMDRQTSSAMAKAASDTHVAEAILTQLVENRRKDLWIDAAGVTYGAVIRPGDAGYTDANAERQTIDYDFVDPADPNTRDDYDKALASIEPNVDANTWRHISVMPNATGNFINVNYRADPNMVDTDGDDTADARLFPTGLYNSSGTQFYAAVRMIDAGGLLNVNYAGVIPVVATSAAMSPGLISLSVLGGPEGTVVSNRADTAGVPDNPYGQGDQLALSWLDGNTAWAGRLAQPFGTAAPPTARNLLTTIGKSRTAVPRRPNDATITGVTLRDTKFNLNDANTASYDELRVTFLRMLQAANPSDPQNPTYAAQLAVNVIDYRDNDVGDNPTVGEIRNLSNNPIGGSTVCGIERQPFITEVYGHCTDANNFDYQIELYNPYDKPIDLTGYDIRASANGGPPPVFSLSGNIIPNGGYFVLTKATPVDWNSVTLTRTVGTDIIMLDYFEGVNGDLTLGSTAGFWKDDWRNDDPSLAYYTDSLGRDYGHSDDPNTDGNSFIGLPNTGRPTFGTPRSVPIYVRNGDFTNVGELNRLFMVGPTNGISLTTAIENTSETTTNIFKGHLGAETAMGNASPQLTAEVLLADYFTVIPSTGNSVAGLVNINTAPKEVIKALPGIAQAGLIPLDPNVIADAIIAYRDKLPNWSNRTTDSNGKTTRENFGFGGCGEICVPLTKVASTPIGYDGSNQPPFSYCLPTASGADDGVPRTLNDFAKNYILYSWLSNLVTVRSDTYIAYIRVQASSSASATNARRYVAVIDRSNCTAAGDSPKVLMFTEIK